MNENVDPEVQRHLRHVVATLSAVDGPAQRAVVLARLAAYAEGGVFPRPTGTIRVRARAVQAPRAFAGPGERMPLFRDGAGTWCAVGHLYAADEPEAAADLADRVGDGYLPEVEDAGLRAWAARSGLTPDELAWIQPTYCFEAPVCDGTETAPAAWTAEARCEGPDVLVSPLEYCQECDGPLRVWALLLNPGATDVTDVTVELYNWGGALDTEIVPVVAAGATVAVELQTTSVTDVGSYGGVRATAAGMCSGVTASEPGSWETNNGGPGMVVPAECDGEGCGYDYYYSDTGNTSEPDTDADTTDGPKTTGTGCATSSSVAGTGWLVAALALLPRRRRSA